MLPGKLVGTGETQIQHRGTAHGLSPKSSGRVRMSAGADAGRLAVGSGASEEPSSQSAHAADCHCELYAWDESASSHAFAVAIDLDAMD